jgi:hypothetical protein
MLNASWKESPLDTLKLIFQARWSNNHDLTNHHRDCRGGKGEKKLFYQALFWLGKNHPAVLSKNLPLIPLFGKWKDLLLFFGTPFEAAALDLFAKQLQVVDLLCIAYFDCRTICPCWKK